MRKLLLAASIATAFVGLPTWALSPAIDISELPTLKQEPQHKVASKRVTGVFTRAHYHRVDLDDAFSEKIFKRFLKQADYRRNVLLQSDVESLAVYDKQFDDMLKSGNLEPAFSMYELLMKRRYERFAFALSLLDTEMDFTKSGDVYQYDREDAPWATTQAELDELWRQRVKFDALNLKLTGKKWPEIVKVLQKRYNNAIKRLSQTHSEDVFQGVMNAFARTIEPHTSYLSPRNAERFQMEMNLSLEGIGAVLQMDDDYTVIKSLVTGGPAASSEQLSPEDKIVGVGQEGEEIVDVIGWRLDDVVDLIKGPKGSKVVLQILPKKGGSNAKIFDVTMTRDKIRLADRAATSEVIEPTEGTYADRKVGVIKVPGFYMNLSQDVKKELLALQKAKVEGVIIDLRGNGGGALSEATLMTGLFIDLGPVVQVRDASGKVSEHRDNDGQATYTGPLTVMINRYSASASEIFAAALQDYGRALVVGESSFGKGTVQQHKGLQRIYDMYEKPVGHVQFTMQKFYRINGGSTQIKGVTPDIKFPSGLDVGQYGEAEQDNALPWDKVPRAKYSVISDVTPVLVGALDKKHLGRVATDVEFEYVKADLEEFKKSHQETSISLVESERIAATELDETKALARANERRIAKGLKAVTSLDDLDTKEKMPDAFLDETAFITLDLVDAERLAKNSVK